MVSKRIKQIIKIYKKDLEKRIKVDKIILFGSYAHGKPRKDSDIDLVILSEDFKKIRFDKRLDILQLARENPETWDYGMDIFGYTEKEFSQASSLTTLGEIKETGKVLNFL